MPLGAFRLNSLGKFTVTAAAEVIRKKKGIQALGNAQIDTAQSKFGGSSALFDGTGDYLEIATDSSLTFTGDFTIEMFYRASATNGALIPLFNTSDHLFYIGYSGGNPVYTVFAGGNNRTSLNAIAGWSLNTWYHVAFVRSGSTITIYHNGTANTTGTWSNTVNTGNPNTIGVYISYYLQGHVDEVRVSNTARYTGSFTPTTTPFVNDENTVLLMHCDGTDAVTYFEDDNGVRTAKGVQAAGNGQIDTAQSKFGGSSYLGDGTGDYLSVTNLSNFAFGTGNFTIEFWIRPNGTPVSNVLLLDSRPANGNGAYPAIYLPGGVVTYYLNSANRITGTTSIASGNWYHIAISRSGSSTRLFVNGTQEGSTFTDSSSFPEPPYWIIGAQSYTLGAASWNGWIDEYRVSNIARYTSNFTAPTAPFTNDSNTLLLLHMDGTDARTVFRDDNGDGRTANGITAFGNAQVDTAQSKFGGSSALFDGTGDYLLVNSEGMTLGSNDWTIEMWIRFTSVPGSGVYDIIYDQRTFGGSNTHPVIFAENSKFAYQAGGSNYYVTFTIVVNTWYHIAVSRSGSTRKFYINGTEYTSTTDTITYTSNPVYIATDTGGLNGFAGHIDEIRVSNSARYTSNFTAPTAPFQNDANTLLLIHADGTDATTVFIDDNGKKPS